METVISAIGQAILLGLLTAAGHWLLARSEVMRWLWSRASGRLDALLRCPACSGFWLGLVGWACGLSPLEGLLAWWPLQAVGAGLLAIFLTPVFEGVLLWGLDRSALDTQHD